MDEETLEVTNGTYLNGQHKGEASQMVAETDKQTPADELMRFQSDLEFVQFLSNPFYVQCSFWHS